MQTLPRVPKDRIGALIGKKGETRKALQKASGCKYLDVDSDTGEVSVTWGETGSYDIIKSMKLPEVIKAIGRGMAPAKAIKLLQDDYYFQLIEIKNYVGKRANQQRRIRARLIGTNGKIRRLIERHSRCEVSVFGGTVVVIGNEEGLPIAVEAINMLLSGSEHGSVIKYLEKQQRLIKSKRREIEYIELREDSLGFEHLVPGLDDVARRRKLKSAQIDLDDQESIDDALSLKEDEEISWSEE